MTCIMTNSEQVRDVSNFISINNKLNKIYYVKDLTFYHKYFKK